MALATEMVGTCQAIFDIVHAYVQEREQFGVKVGSFQAIKHKLANMYVSVESARATAYFAAATIAEADERRDVAVAMAKASVGRLPEARHHRRASSAWAASATRGSTTCTST